MLVIALVMLGAGVLGGTAAHLVQASQKPKADAEAEAETDLPLAFHGNLVVSIVAAFCVPLFLSITGSGLVRDIAGTDFQVADATAAQIDNLLILTGFCLVAALFARPFMAGLSSQVLSTLKAKMSRLEEGQRTIGADQNALRARQEKVDDLVAEQDAALADRRDGPAAVARAPADMVPSPEKLAAISKIADALDERAVKVVRALRHPVYARRSVTGLAADAGLDEGSVGRALAALEQKGLVRKTMSRKTDRYLYELAPDGVLVERELPRA